MRTHLTLIIQKVKAEGQKLLTAQFAQSGFLALQTSLP